MAPRCLRHAGGRRANVSLGRWASGKSSRKFSSSAMGSCSGGRPFRGGERVWRVRSSGQWLGVDFDAVRPLERIQTVPILSRLLGRFLRWQTFRYEGWFGANGCLYGAAIFPELVSAALSVRLRHLPLCGGINDGDCSAISNLNSCQPSLG